MARPRTHALISAALAAGLWQLTGSRAAALATIAGGFLVDGDHLVDLAVVRLTRDRRWFIVPLHGWEYLPAILVAARRSALGPVLAGYALGLTSHLIADQIVNGVGRWGYFFTYRLARGFRGNRLDGEIEFHAWTDQPIWRWF